MLSAWRGLRIRGGHALLAGAEVILNTTARSLHNSAVEAIEFSRGWDSYGYWMRVLREGTGSARVAAWDALANYPAASDTLIARFVDNPRALDTNVTAGFAPPSIATWIGLTQSDSERVRLASLRSLYEMGATGAIPVLRTWLKDPSIRDPARVLDSSSFTHPELTSALTDVLAARETPFLVAKAARTGDFSVWQPLIERFRTADQILKEHIVRAVGVLAHPESESFLLQILTSRREDHFVLRAAHRALANISSPWERHFHHDQTTLRENSTHNVRQYTVDEASLLQTLGAEFITADGRYRVPTEVSSQLSLIPSSRVNAAIDRLIVSDRWTERFAAVAAMTNSRRT